MSCLPLAVMDLPPTQNSTITSKTVCLVLVIQSQLPILTYFSIGCRSQVTDSGHGTVHGNRVLGKKGRWHIIFSMSSSFPWPTRASHGARFVVFACVFFAVHLSQGCWEAGNSYALICVRCRCSFVHSSIERAHIQQTERQRHVTHCPR